MKKSIHKVNVRTIRKMNPGDVLLLRGGKPISWKGGYTIAADDLDTNAARYTITGTAETVRRYSKILSEKIDSKNTLLIIKRRDEKHCTITLGHHYSNPHNEEMVFFIDECNYKIIK